jgi:hypothetical protein
MKYEVYREIEATDDFSAFDFFSRGKNGDILKRVIFTATEDKEVYNLAFGDVDEDNEINDHVITNNGDRNKVLTTVVLIVEAYTRMFPDRWIYFRGSTTDRSRLYRMAISLHLEELSASYEIWALIDGILEPFSKDLKTNAFLIKRKNP